MAAALPVEPTYSSVPREGTEDYFAEQCMCTDDPVIKYLEAYRGVHTYNHQAINRFLAQYYQNGEGTYKDFLKAAECWIAYINYSGATDEVLKGFQKIIFESQPLIQQKICEIILSQEITPTGKSVLVEARKLALQIYQMHERKDCDAEAKIIALKAFYAEYEDRILKKFGVKINMAAVVFDAKSAVSAAVVHEGDQELIDFSTRKSDIVKALDKVNSLLADANLDKHAYAFLILCDLAEQIKAPEGKFTNQEIAAIHSLLGDCYLYAKGVSQDFVTSGINYAKALFNDPTNLVAKDILSRIITELLKADKHDDVQDVFEALLSQEQVTIIKALAHQIAFGDALAKFSARNAMDQLYKSIVATDVNIKAASLYFAVQGCVEAQYDLANDLFEKIVDGYCFNIEYINLILSYLIEATTRGYGKANILLGRCYASGYLGFKIDIIKALDCFLAATADPETKSKGLKYLLCSQFSKHFLDEDIDFIDPHKSEIDTKEKVFKLSHQYSGIYA